MRIGYLNEEKDGWGMMIKERGREVKKGWREETLNLIEARFKFPDTGQINE